MVQLPALNTPQFSWGRTKLPHHPSPVPPIFQPEVAARAILHAARHPQRELLVGWPTLRAIVGNSVVPWYADRYLARRAYDAQQLPEAVSPDRPDNLFAPAPGEWAARGRFNAGARSASLGLWTAAHGRLLLLGAGALGLLTARLATRASR
jgi:hypothetical protein